MNTIVRRVRVTDASFAEVSSLELKTVRVTLGPHDDDGLTRPYPLEFRREAAGDWPLGKDAWIIVTDDPQVLDVLCGATY